MALCLLGGAEVRLGAGAHAISLLEQAVELSARAPIYLAWLGWAHALDGRVDQAREILRELSARSEKDYVSPLCFAWLHSALKEEAVAIEWIEKAGQERSPYLLYWGLPVFDALRPHPRFQALLHKMRVLSERPGPR